MHMKLSCCRQDICLSAELSSSTLSEHLDLNCVQIVEFFIDEAHHHFLETVIVMSS